MIGTRRCRRNIESDIILHIKLIKVTTEKIETKEDIKKIIDTSTDYAELYDNAIKVLQEMESSFKSTLKDLSRQEDWDNRKDRLIKRSIFDDDLNTTNPVTIFEKK
jgi:hypothetical protein